MHLSAAQLCSVNLCHTHTRKLCPCRVRLNAASNAQAKVKAKAEAAAAETPDMENIMSGEDLGTLLALTSGERAEVALSDDDQPIEQAAKRARTAEEPSNGAGFTEEEAGPFQNYPEFYRIPPCSAIFLYSPL